MSIHKSEELVEREVIGRELKIDFTRISTLFNSSKVSDAFPNDQFKCALSDFYCGFS